jgi:hypothetical protein
LSLDSFNDLLMHTYYPQKEFTMSGLNEHSEILILYLQNCRFFQLF